jgi:hypothetical protein
METKPGGIAEEIITDETPTGSKSPENGVRIGRKMAGERCREENVCSYRAKKVGIGEDNDLPKRIESPGVDIDATDPNDRALLTETVPALQECRIRTADRVIWMSPEFPHLVESKLGSPIEHIRPDLQARERVETPIVPTMIV